MSPNMNDLPAPSAMEDHAAWARLAEAEARRREGALDAAEAAYRAAEASAATRVQALLGLGHCAMQRGAVEAALELFRAAMAADPDDPWPALHVADALRLSGALAAAEDGYRAVMGRPGTRLRALLGLGALAMQRGDPQAALAAFDAATHAAPGNPWPWLEAGHAARLLGRPATAEAAFARAGRHPEAEAQALVGWGQSAAQRGDHAAALRHFAGATAANPADHWARLYAGMSLRALGQAEAARAAFAAVLADDPRHAEARVELALLDMQAGQPDAARARLEAALAEWPEHCRALEQLAELERLARAFPRAQALLERAVAAHPANPWPHAALALTLFEMGRHDAALAALDAAQARLGADSAAQAAIAARHCELLRRAGHWPQALAVARQAGARWPHDLTLWVQRCQIELLAGGPDGIARCLADARPVGAEDRARLLHMRGQAAEADWRLDEAAGHFAAALALTPDDAWVRLDAARVAMLRLQPDEARAHLARMAELQASVSRLQGRSPNVSQTHYGQIFDEYDLDPAALAALATLRPRPAGARIPALLAMLRAAPGHTPTAVALLLALREAGFVTTALAPGPAPIPPGIAQYWNEAEPPADIAALMQGWADRHPDHDVRRFDDAAALRFLDEAYAPEVAAAFRRAREPAQRADLFRLAWLFAQGGWYVDADNRCLAPLAAITPAGATLVVYQEDLGTLGNDTIGAIPRHPALGRALAQAVGAINAGAADLLWLNTGPALLTRAFAETLAEAALDPGVAMDGACVLDRRLLCRSLAVHCAAGYKLSGRHWSDAQALRLGWQPEAAP